MRMALLALMLQINAPPVTLDPGAASAKLLSVRRIHVEGFTGENAAIVRDMLIAALHRSRLFVLTENPATADAVLRGSAEDLIYTDVFQTSDGVSARTSLGLGRGASGSRNRESLALGGAVGDNESARIQERRHEAVASVRLVGRDGDVLWTSSQESQGAKYKSAASDVADKITRQLMSDWERLKGGGEESKASPPSPRKGG